MLRHSLSGLLAVGLLLLGGCAGSPASQRPETALPSQTALPVPGPDAELRVDFAHFPVIFDARHAYVSLYDLAGGREALLLRLHATSVELKRELGRPYYEFRHNVGPCLKMIPFIDTGSGAAFMPDWAGRMPLTLEDDAALFQNRKVESVPILAGERDEVLGWFARALTLAQQINDASISYSYRGASNPNSNSAMFAVLQQAGMSAELGTASAGWWFPGEETAIALDAVATPPDGTGEAAFREALTRLQRDIETAKASEPCASF